MRRLTPFIIYLFLVIFLFFCCGPKLDKVERIIEDGVEVVINHVEPYVIDDESKVLKAERKVLLDFESEEISKLGISDIRGFDIDSEGNIFVSVFRGEDCIYKFDKNKHYQPELSLLAKVDLICLYLLYI